MKSCYYASPCYEEACCEICKACSNVATWDSFLPGAFETSATGVFEARDRVHQFELEMMALLNESVPAFIDTWIRVTWETSTGIG